MEETKWNAGGDQSMGGQPAMGGSEPGTAARIGSAAKERAMAQVDGKKSELAGGLEKIADAIDSLAGENSQLPSFAHRGISAASGWVRQCSTLVRDRSSEELLQMATQRAKSRPLALAAGAFVVGFLGSRVVKG